MNNDIEVDALDAFTIGFGAVAIPWAAKAFPLNKIFFNDFLREYSAIVKKYAGNSMLFTPREYDFVNEMRNEFAKAFRDTPRLSDSHDLGDANNLECFRNNYPLDANKLWFIKRLPDKISRYISELSLQLENIQHSMPDIPYFTLGNTVAQCHDWHENYQERCRELVTSLEMLGGINNILKNKYTNELCDLFEKDLPRKKWDFEFFADICRATYASDITGIPHGDSSDRIFMAIYNKYMYALSDNVENIRNEVNENLHISLPNDKQLCLFYITVHFKMILASNIGKGNRQPFAFAEHYIFKITWKLFKKYYSYIQQVTNSYQPKTYHLELKNSTLEEFPCAPQGRESSKGDIKKQKRGALTIKKAAAMVGRSASTVEKWQSGEREAPEGYPGLNNYKSYAIWAASYVNARVGVSEARKKGRARGSGLSE